MTTALPAASIAKLRGVHPRLAAVATRAAEVLAPGPVQFIVTEGRRTLERQRQLLKAGATKTLNSRHLSGHAIDVAAVVNGQVRWDWPLYRALAVAFKKAAAEQKTVLTWGGDWRTFKDGPHFELNPDRYPFPSPERKSVHA